MANTVTTFSCFPSTQWSQIMEVIQSGDRPAAEAALNEFCLQYREAVCQFFRRLGSNQTEAEDLTQNFFHKRILAGWADREGILYSARRQPGRNFRAFLAASLKHFRTEQWRAANSLKAGGGIPHEPLTETEAAAGASPAATTGEFDRAFALNAIRHAAERATRSHAFLDYFLRKEQGGEDVAQQAAADELDITVGAFKRGYHAFRLRLKDELWKEVAKYAGPEPADIAAEMAYLITLFPDSFP
jgi:DNA-directed RNA polymerase specialized sigma24 family protein